jgi:hypothetical protein
MLMVAACQPAAAYNLRPAHLLTQPPPHPLARPALPCPPPPTTFHQVPAPFNLEEVMRSKGDDPSALHVVLFQEVERYNGLLVGVRRSCVELQKGIQGLVVMSADLDQVGGPDKGSKGDSTVAGGSSVHVHVMRREAPSWCCPRHPLSHCGCKRGACPSSSWPWAPWSTPNLSLTVPVNITTCLSSIQPG